MHDFSPEIINICQKSSAHQITSQNPLELSGQLLELACVE